MSKFLEMKQRDISGLKRNYFMRFQIGIIIALSLSLAAFNFTTYPAPKKVQDVILIPMDKEIEVIRTAEDRPKEIPPPPQPKVSEIIIPVEDIEPIEEKPEEVPEKIEIPDNVKAVFVAPKPKAAKVIENPVVIEPEEIVPEVDEIKNVVDEMPRFVHCSELEDDKQALHSCADSKLIQYVASRIKYPAIAKENGIEGKVILQFVVEKDGSVSNAKIVRDIGGGCGKEALRVVNELPNWIPGKQRSVPVRVRFTLPVKFAFQ